LRKEKNVVWTHYLQKRPCRLYLIQNITPEGAERQGSQKDWFFLGYEERGRKIVMEESFE